MNVEKIDDVFVMFNGKKFRKDKRSGYYWTTKVPRRSLHLSIFEFHGNTRPEGYELHHIDFNKENNDISNIACLKKKIIEIYTLNTRKNSMVTNGIGRM